MQDTLYTKSLFPVLGVLREIQYSFSFFFSFFLSFFMYISVSATDPLPLHTPLPLGGYFGLKNWTKSLAVSLSDIKSLFKH